MTKKQAFIDALQFIHCCVERFPENSVLLNVNPRFLGVVMFIPKGTNLQDSEIALLMKEPLFDVDACIYDLEGCDRDSLHVDWCFK